MLFFFRFFLKIFLVASERKRVCINTIVLYSEYSEDYSEFSFADRGRTNGRKLYELYTKIKYKFVKHNLCKIVLCDKWLKINSFFSN